MTNGYENVRIAVAALAMGALGAAALAAVPQQPVLDHYAALDKAAGGDGTFSADRGKAFFLAKHTHNAKLTSCTSCHTTDPHNVGHLPTGRQLKPMAVSLSPNRFTRLGKVEKWAQRNCTTVVGRACTAKEIGDYITYMMSQ
ncbi:MAG: DUF1924 domain-containing protein [Hyphomicrobiales bacterium]|nr:DUF1924 domain-containing protein [Hyphomicrobiales bacterium]